MKSRHMLLGVAAALAILSGPLGCAKVKFYADKELKTETAFKFYHAKPYLLVVETGAKDKPREASIIYLPDLEHPVWAKYKPGLGTHEFTLATPNGMISSYGQKADSKIPETLTAIGSLAASAATAATQIGALLREEAAKDRGPVAARLREIAADLRAAIRTRPVPLTEGQETLTDSIDGDLERVATELDQATTTAEDMSIGAEIRSVARKFTELLINSSAKDVDAGRHDSLISRLQTELNAQANRIDPPTARKVRLFEIDVRNGRTILTEVELPEI